MCIGRCWGSAAYAIERMSQFVALTCVVLCLVITILTMLGLGVGLGYNYCFVEYHLNRTRSGTVMVTSKPKARAGTLAESSDGGSSDSGEIGVETQISKIPGRRTKEEPTSLDEIKPYMVVSLYRNDLCSLMAAIQKRDMNVTLQLIALNFN